MRSGELYSRLKLFSWFKILAFTAGFTTPAHAAAHDVSFAHNERTEVLRSSRDCACAEGC